MSIYGKITLATLKALHDVEPAGATAVGELCHAAFKLVANGDDWKAPIDRTVFVRHESYAPDAIAYAIEYVTATKPTVTVVGDGVFRFVADGYRKGPAGDH